MPSPTIRPRHASAAAAGGNDATSNEPNTTTHDHHHHVEPPCRPASSTPNSSTTARPRRAAGHPHHVAAPPRPDDRARPRPPRQHPNLSWPVVRTDLEGHATPTRRHRARLHLPDRRRHHQRHRRRRRPPPGTATSDPKGAGHARTCRRPLPRAVVGSSRQTACARVWNRAEAILDGLPRFSASPALRRPASRRSRCGSPRTAAACDMPLWTKVCGEAPTESSWRRADLKIFRSFGDVGGPRPQEPSPGPAVVCGARPRGQQRELLGRHDVTLSHHHSRCRGSTALPGRTPGRRSRPVHARSAHAETPSKRPMSYSVRCSSRGRSRPPTAPKRKVSPRPRRRLSDTCQRRSVMWRSAGSRRGVLMCGWCRDVGRSRMRRGLSDVPLW